MMATNIKIRSRRTDDICEIKLLLSHPMENGRNRDPLNGELIPAHFITDLDIALNGTPVISAELGPSLSKDPFFTFRLKTSRSGDILTAKWLDNLGNSDSADHTLE